MLADHPLLAVASAVVLLLAMILWLRWQAFIALLLSSLIFAVLVYLAGTSLLLLARQGELIERMGLHNYVQLQSQAAGEK